MDWRRLRSALRPHGFWRTAAVSLLMGVVLWRVAFLLIPLAVRLGMTQPFAFSNLPVLGFVLGLALGVGARVSARINEAVWAVAAIFLMGATGWSLALLLGAVLMVFGADNETVDLLTPAGFYVGAAIGSLPSVLYGLDFLKRLFNRPRSEPREGSGA